MDGTLVCIYLCVVCNDHEGCGMQFINHPHPPFHTSEPRDCHFTTEEVQSAVECFLKYHVYVVTMRSIWPGKFKSWGYKNIDAGTESIRHISLQWETEGTELRSSTLAGKSFECFWILRIKERRAGVGNFANVELYQIQNFTNFHPGNCSGNL